MKKFYIFLREYATNVINFEKKKMLPLTNLTFKKIAKDKNFQKFRDHCHFTGKYKDAAHCMYNLRFNMPNEIPVVLHSGSNYD